MSLYMGNEKVSNITVSFGYNGGATSVEVATPTIDVDESGLITATTEQSEGYVLADTKSATEQLPTQEAKTITPSSVSQIAVDTGKYTTGDVTVAPVPTETTNVSTNGTYTPSDGKYFSSVTVNVPSETVDLQEKTITPTESQQVVTPDANYDGLSSVTVDAISSTYVGSDIQRNGAVNGTITTQGGEFTIPSGLTDGGKVTANIESTPITNEIINGATNINETSNSIDDFTVTVNVPAGYHEAQTLTKTFSDILPGLDIDASADKILNTYQAYDETGKVITGSMTDNGAFNRTLDKNTTSVTIPAGYHNGAGVITRSVNIQEKTVTPTETVQYATPDTDYDGLSKVTVDAISPTYVGSGITRNPEPTANGATVTIPSGYYSAETTKSVNAGALGTVSASKGAVSGNSVTVTPSISGGTAGYITETSKTGSGVTITAAELVSGNKEVTATETAQNNIDVTNNATVSVAAISNTYVGSAIPRVAAQEIVPTTTDQTIAADQYLTGVQTIKGDANLTSENIAAGTTIFGITGTHEGGGGIDTSDADATAADIVKDKTAYVNGVKVTGTLEVQNYYTGTATPEPTDGNDGDLYFKVSR